MWKNWGKNGECGPWRARKTVAHGTETWILTPVLIKPTDTENTVIKLNWKVSMKRTLPSKFLLTPKILGVCLTQLKWLYSIYRVGKFPSDFLKQQKLSYIIKKQLSGYLEYTCLFKACLKCYIHLQWITSYGCCLQTVMPTRLFLCSLSKQAVFNLGSFLGKL